MNIVLIGMKHCGKTTIGTGLADADESPFFDVDDLIQVLYAERTGTPKSVRSIFREHGAEYFADLEANAVIELQKVLMNCDGPSVIGLGGRTALNPRVREMLPHLGLIVYLQVDPETLWQRVQAGGIPPFLDADRPEESFMELYEQRREAYESLAQVTVNLDGLDPEEAVGTVRSTVDAFVAMIGGTDGCGSCGHCGGCGGH
ncbi:MAG: shikimate kinase [Phycisphaerae bacterium]